MPSIFRQDLCLPFLFYEHLRESCADGALSEGNIAEAYSATFGRDAGGELPEIAKRLVQEATDASSFDRPIESAVKKKLFGTGFTDYLSGLDSVALCFLLADHDPVKASEFYCRVDMRVVTAAAQAKVLHLSQLSGVWYESVMFGMGGHYKDHGPQDNITDMTANPDAAKQRLKKLGLS